jgi:hypothetical protein
MLVAEWSCNLFEILLWNWSTSFLVLAQKGTHMLQPLGEETFALMSNVLKKGVALSYLPLLPPTRTNDNPTKV